MRSLKSQRGSLLLIAVALIVLVSAMAVAISRLIVSDATSGAHHSNSAQALFVADSGIERALYGFRTGMACNALAFNNVAVGNGTFTTTGTLFQPASTNTTAAINAAVTVIPVTNTAFYAPHGRITIDAEQMDYTGVTAASFTGVRRGVNGTTAAAHANNRPVVQNLCRVRSTGTVGASQRVVDTTAIATTARSFDTGSAAIATNVAGTNIGGLLNTALPVGTNLIVAIVSLENSTNNIRNITAGNLRIMRGATILSSTQYISRLGGNGAPSANSFARETVVLLARDLAAPANATYRIYARASGNGVSGEAKVLIINNPPAQGFVDGGANNSINNAPAGTNLVNTAFALPAGAKLVIAAVQFYNQNNPAGTIRSVAAGNLQLRRGATVLAANQFAIDHAGNAAANSSTGLLLLGLDAVAPANPTYTVNARATGGTNLRGEAKLIVLGSLTGATFDGGAVPVAAADTVIGSLATTIPAGEQVVIAATQYQNTAAAARSIVAGAERLLVGGVPQAVSQYGLNLCGTGVPSFIVCDDFTSGQLWRTQTGVASPTFEMRAQASAVGMNAEAKIMAIGMNSAVNVIDWLEVFQ